MLTVLVGRSASGKDTIKKELIRRGMNSIVTYTTRTPRDGEVDGIAYHFVSLEDFLTKELKGHFAEITHYNTANMGTVYYGTALEDLKNASDNTVIILNPDGLKAIKKIEGLDFTSFYIIAKKSVLKKRLRERGDNRKEAKRRIKADRKDFKDMIYEVDYIIENNGNKSIAKLADTIQFIVNYKRGERDSK